VETRHKDFTTIKAATVPEQRQCNEIAQVLGVDAKHVRAGAHAHQEWLVGGEGGVWQPQPYPHQP
jgi:hypothetical protein